MTGKKDSKRVKEDIWKLFAAFSVSEIIYSVMKISIHYQILQLGAQPYQASMISSLNAWGVFLVSINLSARMQFFLRRHSISYSNSFFGLPSYFTGIIK